jgi:signal transduction histidine kinase
MSEPSSRDTREAFARLLSLAVHEFRTPTSVVAGYLRMLQRDTDQPPTERHRRMIEEAAKSCGRLVALIDELSEISKLDAGTAAVATASFDLFAVVREVADGVHEAGDREVRLHVRGEDAGAPFTGDLPRIRAAFDAFFRAILREQPAGATVVVDRRRTLEGGASSAVVVVARDADVQRAYEAEAGPFDDKRGGLGLALPIARRVVERHGGRVWSPAVPAGGEPLAGRSAVLIHLPLREQQS